MRKVALLILFIGLGFQGNAQSIKVRLAPEAGLGMRFGVWVFDKGVVDSLHTGYDNSHASAFFPFQAGLWVGINKFNVGAGLSFLIFDDDEMRAGNYTDPAYDRYVVTENFARAKWLKFYLQMEYALAHKGIYTLYPHVKAGTFLDFNAHPAEEFHRFKLSFDLGFTNEFMVNERSTIMDIY